MMRPRIALASYRSARLGRVTLICIICLVLVIFAWLTFLSWAVLGRVQSPPITAASRPQSSTDRIRLDEINTVQGRKRPEPPVAEGKRGAEGLVSKDAESESSRKDEQSGKQSTTKTDEKTSPKPAISPGSARPPIRPRWDPDLVEAIRNNASGLFEALKTLHPAEPDESLRIRAEFGTLAVCNPYNTWYVCLDNPTCVMMPSCSHRTKSDVVFGNMHEVAFRFHNEREERREVLKKLLDRFNRQMQRKEDDRLVFLMTLNSGFSFLFANWLCSLTKNGIDVELVKRRTIVLPRDRDARFFVLSLGFFAPSDEEMAALTHWTATHTVSRKAAPLFGQGDHNIINLFFKFGMPLDMLSLGYSIINQDVDFVWKKDPVPELIRKCEESDCHGVFIEEGRDYGPEDGSSSGTFRKAGRPHRELNTGLNLLRSTPETIHFLEVLIHGVFLQQWRRRDQLYYNTVLWHEHFSHMNWQVLSDDEFVPGKRLHSKDLQHRPLIDDKVFVLHVSDTSNYQSKIERLKAIKHWYFNKKECAVPVELCRTQTTCWASVRHCTDCGF